MSALAPPRPGLVHLGLHYRSPGELATIVAPHVRAALGEGRAVYAMVDDDVASALGALLGPMVDRVRFPPASNLRGLSPEAFLGRLRAWCAGGPTLVVTQYSVVAGSDDDCAVMEDGVNLVLADLPLTLLCACSRTDGPVLMGLSGRTHPGWADSRSVRGNPGFRAPVDRSMSRSGMWGRLVLRTSFRGLVDLARVRHQVIELVCEIGLCGTDADAAVLAVHEAAALACRSGDETGAAVEPDSAERLVEVRTTATSLFAEVRAPGFPASVRHADAHTLLGPAVSDADVLRPLTWFCHRAAVHDDGRTRTIRVLVDRRGPLAYRG